MDFNDPVITFLFSASVVVLFIVIVVRLLVVLLAGRQRPTVSELDARADIEGAAGGREDEQKMKKIFAEFRRKENLQ